MTFQMILPVFITHYIASKRPTFFFLPGAQNPLQLWNTAVPNQGFMMGVRINSGESAYLGRSTANRVKSKTEVSGEHAQETPLMRRYLKIKSQHPDALLLFRVGDFYETFGEDAVRTSEALGIVLTHRNNGGSNIELAGFPYHAMDMYLPKLVQAGYRVAICEQLEKPSKEKKIVDRGVTEMITPGVATADSLLHRSANNYLAAVSIQSPDHIGVAFLDLSTGEFVVSEGASREVAKLLQSFDPAEIIYAKGSKVRLESLFGEAYYTF